MIKIPRPRVRKIQPTSLSNSVLTGPCWSGFIGLFEDSDYLQSENPAKRRRKIKGKNIICVFGNIIVGSFSWFKINPTIELFSVT